MCSICRNKRCTYQFGKEKWRPPDDGMVTIQLPETDGTLLEAVRAQEEMMRRTVTSTLGVPKRMLKGKP